MQLKKLSKRFGHALGILFIGMGLSGCTTVVIHDAEWCGDLGAQGAICFHTLTSETRDIAEPEWTSTRFGMVCTEAKNFADLKDEIEKLCHETRKCSYELKEHVAEFFDHLDELKMRTSYPSAPL